MTPDQVAAFRASLQRCLAEPAFMKDFYDRFMASSDEVRELFRDTDFARQNRVLADSLYVMAVAAEGGPKNMAWGEMSRLKERHHGLGVQERHFGLWLEALVAAVRAHDPQFTPELEAVWRATLQPGLDHMTRPTEAG